MVHMLYENEVNHYKNMELEYITQGMKDAADIIEHESKHARDMILHAIGERYIRFWMCPNGCSNSEKRGSVHWDGQVAICQECGEQSA